MSIILLDLYRLLISLNKFGYPIMTDFFANMETTQRLYWYFAIGASIVFIIQTIMTFIGADTDTGMDADFDGNMDAGAYPFQLFSLRNLVNFLLGLGWAGATLYDVIDNQLILAIVAVLVGLLFVFIFFLIIKALMKLAEDNSFHLESTIGKTGDVYLTIPPNREGKGKIFISSNGSTRELDAITKHDKPINNGMLIKVVAVDGDILVVEPLNKI